MENRSGDKQLDGGAEQARISHVSYLVFRVIVTWKISCVVVER